MCKTKKLSCCALFLLLLPFLAFSQKSKWKTHQLNEQRDYVLNLIEVEFELGFSDSTNVAVSDCVVERMQRTYSTYYDMAAYFQTESVNMQDEMTRMIFACTDDIYPEGWPPKWKERMISACQQEASKTNQDRTPVSNAFCSCYFIKI